MIIKPKGFDYQRNGVSGTPFYTLVFDWYDRISKEQADGFIATFEVDGKDENISIQSCRVIDPKNPFSSWRGDVFAEAINETLKQLRIEYNHDSIGDLEVLINSGGF